MPPSFNHLSLLRILPALGAALFVATCRKPAGVQPSGPRIRRASALGWMRQAVLRSGGEEVWVKGSAAGEFSITGEPVRVLAVSSVFRKVVDALEHEAARHALRVRASAGRSPNGERVVWLLFSEAGSWQSEWRVREVPRLLRAAIIIDDMGANDDATRQLLAIPYALTFSVLPRLRYSVETADQVFRAGHDVMLHLPMEPIVRRGVYASPDQIRVGMGARAVDRLIGGDLEAVPHVRGVNNHEGSRATADPRLMAEVMSALARRRLFFVDSRTIGSSIAWEKARQAGVPTFFRSVFLDDRQSVSYTRGQLLLLEWAVRRQGVALAIGHPHPTTIRALREFLPSLARDDIELLPVSQIVRLPEAARLHPPQPGRSIVSKSTSSKTIAPRL